MANKWNKGKKAKTKYYQAQMYLLHSLVNWWVGSKLRRFPTEAAHVGMFPTWIYMVQPCGEGKKNITNVISTYCKRWQKGME